MSRPRLAYQQERIALAAAKARARRGHPQPCECPYCITSDRVREIILARVKAQRDAAGEAPF